MEKTHEIYRLEIGEIKGAPWKEGLRGWKSTYLGEEATRILKIFPENLELEGILRVFNGDFGIL